MNDEWHASQTQMKVCRPAKADAPRFHQIQSSGIGKRQILISELSYPKGVVMSCGGSALSSQLRILPRKDLPVYES
jgi:hypothetical protein